MIQSDYERESESRLTAAAALNSLPAFNSSNLQQVRVESVTSFARSYKLNTRSDAQVRLATAAELPFFLRAWWLRDRSDTEGIEFGDHSSATLPLWSMHSDPSCDASAMDSFAL